MSIQFYFPPWLKIICNKLKPAVFDLFKGNYHVTVSVSIQRAREWQIYLFVFKTETEKTQKSLPDFPSKLKDKKNRGSRIHPVENLAGWTGITGMFHDVNMCQCNVLHWKMTHSHVHPVFAIFFQFVSISSAMVSRKRKKRPKVVNCLNTLWTFLWRTAAELKIY